MAPDSRRSSLDTFRFAEQKYLTQLLLKSYITLPFLFRALRLLSKASYYIAHPGNFIIKVKYYLAKWTGRDVRSYIIKDTFTDAYRRKSLDYLQWAAGFRASISTHDALHNLLYSKSYQGVLIYPTTVPWEPVQRPQQLLRAMGQRGYLCLFCEEYQPHFQLKQVSENVYTVPGEQHLIAYFQSEPVIILCTWMMNLPFFNMLPESFIWYDIIDRLEIFSLYDEDMLRKHQSLVACANIVSYSAQELQSFTESRLDALYLPNGVTVEDFINPPSVVPGDPILKLLHSARQNKRPIIGFYGAIAEWLDIDLVQALAQSCPGWDFFLIGRIWIDVSRLSKIPNLHMTGVVPYNSLPAYASQFDVAIIPFIVNKLTDSVSPIKLFEYAANSLPVVASPFHEIRQYEHLPFLSLAADADMFITAIQNALLKTDSNMKCIAVEFARENHWRVRTEAVDRAIKNFPVH